MQIIAEIGINHNGCIDLALEMIRSAKKAGATVVKFQKREPEVCVPKKQWDIKRDTPWGRMTYIEYKKHMEFGIVEYDRINELCKEIDIEWTVSVWDIDSLNFVMDNYKDDIPFIKIPSAKITDVKLLEEIDFPTVISTGMSDVSEITTAIGKLKEALIGIMICNSSYPSLENEMDLNTMNTIKDILKCHFMNDVKIGYSGHEVGYFPSIIAYTMGAEIIERHFTLDNNMWGTDQQCSLNPNDFKSMIEKFKRVDIIRGNSIIKCYGSEEEVKKKLR